MKPSIKSKKLAQWGWFAGLWCIGLVAAATLSYVIRLMVQTG